MILNVPKNEQKYRKKPDLLKQKLAINPRIEGLAIKIVSILGHKTALYPHEKGHLGPKTEP